METVIKDATLDFIYSLDKETKRKIFRSILLLKAFSFKLQMPHSKKITENIFELRINGKIKVRLFYRFHENKIKIFYGFIKKLRKFRREK